MSVTSRTGTPARAADIRVTLANGEVVNLTRSTAADVDITSSTLYVGITRLRRQTEDPSRYRALEALRPLYWKRLAFRSRLEPDLYDAIVGRQGERLELTTRAVDDLVDQARANRPSRFRRDPATRAARDTLRLLTQLTASNTPRALAFGRQIPVTTAATRTDLEETIERFTARIETQEQLRGEILEAHGWDQTVFGTRLSGRAWTRGSKVQQLGRLAGLYEGLGREYDEPIGDEVRLVQPHIDGLLHEAGIGRSLDLGPTTGIA